MKLPVLCPQEYSDVATMRVTPCDRCSSGWSKKELRCTVETGCEHLPPVPTSEIPSCPLEGRCQHDLQQEGPCVVRFRGMICESALAHAGVLDPENHPLAFNAQLM